MCLIGFLPIGGNRVLSARLDGKDGLCFFHNSPTLLSQASLFQQYLQFFNSFISRVINHFINKIQRNKH